MLQSSLTGSTSYHSSTADSTEQEGLEFMLNHKKCVLHFVQEWANIVGAPFKQDHTINAFLEVRHLHIVRLFCHFKIVIQIELYTRIEWSKAYCLGQFVKFFYCLSSHELEIYQYSKLFLQHEGK